MQSIDLPGTSSQMNRRSLLDAVRVLVLVGALSLIAIGVMAGGLGVLTIFLEPSDQVLLTTFSVSFMALTAGLGAALAWQAWQSIQGRGSRWYHPRLVGIWALLFLLIVILGELVLRSNWLPSLAFPPLHILAAVLPPMVTVALVARYLGSITRSRDVVLQLSSGALVSTLLAFTLEIAIVLTILVGILTLSALQPGGLEQIQALGSRLQDPAWLENPSQLPDLARSPLVLLAAFLVFAVCVPLIEEAVKAIGVPLRIYRRPGPSQAFLWGLAGGAGFALAEGLFNSLGGLEAWAAIVSLRVGATLLHCFTGALMGLAWYLALLERRWGWGLGIYAASAGIHGIWNALVAGVAVLSLGTEGSQLPPAGQMTGNLGTGVVFLLLTGLALAVAVGLMILTRYVRDRTVVFETSRTCAALSGSETSQAAGKPGECS
jgi:hypothetical protein